MHQKYEVEDIPSSMAAGWVSDIHVDTKNNRLSKVHLHNDTLGLDLIYGKKPEGYDGITIRNRNGGSVIIPFSIVDDEVYIGMAHEYRPASGGYVWNVPRGFIDPGENSADAASRELKEDTGIAARDIKLLSSNINCDSTFFDITKDGGVYFYGVYIDKDLLVQSDEGYVIEEAQNHYVNKAGEKISKCRFFPIGRAITKSNDMFTLAGCGLIFDYLNKQSKGANDV